MFVCVSVCCSNRSIRKHAVCVSVRDGGVCGEQEAWPVGKHHSERSRGRLMVTASTGLAAPEDTHRADVVRLSDCQTVRSIQTTDSKKI